MRPLIRTNVGKYSSKGQSTFTNFAQNKSELLSKSRVIFDNGNVDIWPPNYRMLLTTLASNANFFSTVLSMHVC